MTAACVFAENGGYKFVCGGPHYPDDSLGDDEAAAKLQESCMTDMEKFIRTYCDQWFHFRPFGEEAQ